MAYVMPQVLVFQDFNASPSAVATPLSAHISGPDAYLARYSVPAEQETIALDYYDPYENHSFSWPGIPAGGIVDDTYVKLWMPNALLQYYQDTIAEDGQVTKVANYNNRVRAAYTNFAPNGAYALSGELLRAVQPGDVAQIRGVTEEGASIYLWTSVQAIVGDSLASEVDDATSDADNAATQSESAAVVQIAGDINNVVPTANGSEYNGLASGYITETYDLLVITGSVNGDYTQAVVRVISGSGTDDQTSVAPEPNGMATTIGTRGLTVTFTDDPSESGSESAQAEGVTPYDLVTGQRWRVTVSQAFTAPAATSGGTYAGTNNTTYIVSVTRGGHYTDAVQPQISVTTSNGTDLSGPTTITAAATAVAAGTLGVTVEFSGTGLRTGDVYYIECLGIATGPMRTLVLMNNLSSLIPSGSSVDLTLYIDNPLLQIPQDRIGYAPETNWSTSAEQITIEAGLMAYDPSWTNDGVPVALPVFSAPTLLYGMLYVEYRAWIPGLSEAVQSISDVGDLTTMFTGPLTPDNPLMWGVSQALANSNGTPVLFTSIANPDDPDSWVDCLDIILGYSGAYGLVPLTTNQTVLELYQAQVDDQSSAEYGNWCVLWVNLQGLPEIPIVSAGSTIPNYTQATTTDGNVALGTITQDPNYVGASYTILQCTTANADFITNEVQAGDIVRIQYTGDGFGDYTYSEYVVNSVVSQEELQLLAGPNAPLNLPSKFEIWRNLNATQEAAAIALTAGAWDDMRVRATWPDTIVSGTTTMAGYFLNCALAGLCSGVLPQQGLTHLAIAGYTSVPRTTQHFNRAQLDTLAGSGTWIVTQDPVSGNIYTRHAVTTAPYANVDQREEMVVRNVDSISFQFQSSLAPYIGVTNVTPSNQATILLQVTNLIGQLSNASATPSLGAQLNSATVVSFGPSLVFQDRYVLVLDINVPIALNNIECHIVVGG